MRNRTSGKCTSCGKRTQGKYGDKPCCRVCKHSIDFQQRDSSLNQLSEFDLGWLSGIIEGEGCFYCKQSTSKTKSGTYCYPLCGFALMSTDLDVMQHLSSLLNLPLGGPYYKNRKRKKVWSVQVTGYKAIPIMNLFRQHLGERRKLQIDEAINWQKKGKFKSQA